MQRSKNVEKMAISLFFSRKEHRCLQKNTICNRLNISIYELDRIIEKHYAELGKADVLKLKWIQTHPNSYTLSKKQSFIDFIVKKEHTRHARQQLKEKSFFEGGVSNAS